MTVALRVELRGSYTASAAGITVDYETRRRGSPICALARKLTNAGHDPAIELHIYRDGTLCFRPTPLGVWAGLRVKDGNRDSVRFAPHRDHPADTGDSGGRERPFTGHPAVSGDRMPDDIDAALGGEGVTHKEVGAEA